jgi:hypothetical protein
MILMNCSVVASLGGVCRVGQGQVGPPDMEVAIDKRRFVHWHFLIS